MKRLVLILTTAMLCLSASDVLAQGWLGGVAERAAERAKNSVKNRVEQKVDDKVDEGVDRLFGIGSKKSKKADETPEEAEPETTSAGSGWICEECGKAGNTGKFCADCGARQPSAGSADKAAVQPARKSISASYAKCDFVPGDEVFFDDDFANEQLGEFPSKWDLLEGNAEVAKAEGKMCISFEPGAWIEVLMKDQKSYLPDVFTVEFDFFRADEETNMSYMVRFPDGNHDDAINLNLNNGDSNLEYFTPSNDYRSANYSWKEGDITLNAWNHCAISFNKRALKVYVNGTRIYNIPNAVVPKRIWLACVGWGGYNNDHNNFITNVRYCKGAVPLYDRLTSEGKIITYAITFETGKAELKPESIVEIARIAKLMQENPNLNFEVQGHCDTQGSDKVNDPLSQKRAEAIVAALVEQGIASARLTAVGKGSHSPIASNSTDEGRARNRRVEFVKK